tara:strand:+ start:309 stop:623 length:315 start_codon:yes stop_codon:yes gene_type:complete
MQSDYQKIQHARKTGEYDHDLVRKTSDLYRFAVMAGASASCVGAALAITAIFPAAPVFLAVGVTAPFSLAAGGSLARTVAKKILGHARYTYRPNPNRCTLKHKI